MEKNETGVLSYCSALKIPADQCTSFEQYSPDQHVSPQTPPTFIYHTTDDELVPVAATRRGTGSDTCTTFVGRKAFRPADRSG